MQARTCYVKSCCAVLLVLALAGAAHAQFGAMSRAMDQAGHDISGEQSPWGDGKNTLEALAGVWQLEDDPGVLLVFEDDSMRYEMEGAQEQALRIEVFADDPDLATRRPDNYGDWLWYADTGGSGHIEELTAERLCILEPGDPAPTCFVRVAQP